MKPTGDPAALMSEVVNRVRQTKVLYFRGTKKITFGGRTDLLTVSLRPILARVEVWHRSPQWRLQMSAGTDRVTWVFREGEGYGYLFSKGLWMKRPLPKIASPDTLKLYMLGLDRAENITYTFLGERVSKSEPLWVVQGLSETGERFTWWIRKKDLAPNRVTKKGGYFTFAYGGKEQRCPLAITDVLRVEAIEFDLTIPNDMFVVPPDVSVEEVAQAEERTAADSVPSLVEQIIHWLQQEMTEN